MYMFTTIVQGVVLLGAVLVVYAFLESRRYKTGAGEEIAGICRSVVESVSKKEERMDRVLALLREHGELSNAEIRRELGVSSRSVVCYMDALEEEGTVQQVGEIGHTVRYSLKHPQ
jgi:biotin operon repressor